MKSHRSGETYECDVDFGKENCESWIFVEYAEKKGSRWFIGGTNHPGRHACCAYHSRLLTLKYEGYSWWGSTHPIVEEVGELEKPLMTTTSDSDPTSAFSAGPDDFEAWYWYENAK